jgi:hypothetical protein
VYPPLSCINKTVAFLAAHYPQARVIFIAPKWRAQPWYRELKDRCTHVFELPANNSLHVYVDTGAGVQNIGKQTWRTCLFLLNITIDDPKRFQRALMTTPSPHRDLKSAKRAKKGAGN